MLILGVILLLIGLFAHIPILWTIGIILLIIGAIFWILGATGRAVAGRRYWY
jgi:Zn-dependent membrane protease YugP